MHLEALALAVDEHIRVPAAERSDGRLYAVRCEPAAPAEPSGPGVGRDDGSDDDTPPPSCPAAGHPGPAATDGVVLELLARGEARTLPRKVRPPAGLQAIALSSGVWAAPWNPTVSPPASTPNAAVPT